MKKVIAALLLSSLLCVCCLPCAAEDTDYAEEFRLALPLEIQNETILRADADSLLHLDLPEILRYCMRSFSSSLESVLRGFLSVAVLLIFLSFFQMGDESGLINGLSRRQAEFCGMCGIAAVLFPMMRNLFTALQTVLSEMSGFFSGMLPIMQAVLISGGNESVMAVSSSTLSLFLAVLDGLSKRILLPLLYLCFGMCLLSVIPSGFRLSALSDVVCRVFSFLCGGYMAVLLTVFSFQTSVAAAGDSAIMRALRFSAGNWIPVVGSSVSEAMKTVYGSLSVVKSVLGGAAVAAILLLSLPLLLRLFLVDCGMRALIFLSGLLELSFVCDLLKSVRQICGFMLALLAMFSVSGIFQMAVFMKLFLAAGV